MIGFVIGGDGSAALSHPWASLHLCFLHVNLTRYADFIPDYPCPSPCRAIAFNAMFKFAPDKFVIHNLTTNKKPHYLKR